MAGRMINYRLRPRKNVERKLIVDLLSGVGGSVHFPCYAYVGLGSFWFDDFILFHKQLRIENMYSIEYPKYADRAEFNKPLRCIQVVPGETTMVLPDLPWTSNRAIAWLDYTSGLDGPVFDDVRVVTEECLSGSVLLVTLNAHHRQLDNVDSGSGTDRAARFNVLSELAGDSLPLGASEGMVTRRHFPEIVAQTVLNFIHHSVVAAGRSMDFLPLISIQYADGAPMVTVGGAIGNTTDLAPFSSASGAEDWEMFNRRPPFEIEVPELTMREKLALDRHLPSPSGPDPESVASDLGFHFEESTLRQYERFYRYYPSFGEMNL